MLPVRSTNRPDGLGTVGGGRELRELITVLFACVRNAGRSQMAAAFFNSLADPQKARAISAGTNPGDAVNPAVVTTMAEIGLDLSGCSPQRLTEDLAKGAQLLVTMGCGEQCPVVPGLSRLDWSIPDPEDQPPEFLDAIRDEVRARVLYLLKERKWMAEPAGQAPGRH